MRKILNWLDKRIGFDVVSAHCDVPCGIYDPHEAQLAAHTVIRMTQMLEKASDPHKVARYTAVKEKYAEIAKHELRVLWGDYFKPQHFEQFPELQDLIWKAMKQASRARQEINMQVSQELLTTIQSISEIFWKTKGLEPVRVKAPYPTGGEMVLHK